MSPVVKCWSDLHTVYESSGKDHSDIYTTFTTIDDDDVVYAGRLDIPRQDISLEQVTAALTLVPDDHVYPRLSSSRECFTVVPNDVSKKERRLHQTAASRPVRDLQRGGNSASSTCRGSGRSPRAPGHLQKAPSWSRKLLRLPRSTGPHYRPSSRKAPQRSKSASRESRAGG